MVLTLILLFSSRGFNLCSRWEGLLQLPAFSPILTWAVEEISFFFVVLYIILLVLSYMAYYRKSDLLASRLRSCTKLFSLGIIMILLSGNVFNTIIGWDMLGVSRFFLVLFYIRPSSIRRAMITGISNRLGDILLLISL